MKGKFFQFALGVMTGAALFGEASAVAAGIVAEPSRSPIFVDGQQVQMTAYNILGSNYVKLRDIGKAVGFNVYWSNGVQVDSGAPYTGEAPAQAVQAISAEAVRVSCYKDGPLAAGDGSALIIYPSGTEYTVVSSDPAVAAVEKVLDQFWKVVAVSPGTATITAATPDGRSGSVEVTVEGEGQANTETSLDLSANMDIRQEMIRLINGIRRESGKAELPVNAALMDAAQDVSAQCVTAHRPYDHKALIRYGWPYAGMYNLTVFGADAAPNIAQMAVANWAASPGHLETMLMDEASCLGTGVTFNGGRVYCYMVVGDPTGHNPYE